MDSKLKSKPVNNLETLPRTDCLPAYESLKANAEVLFSIAEDASIQGNYGAARSLLILGSEEYIKGAILYLKSIGVNAVRIPEVSGALKNSHKRRHEAAMLFDLLNAVSVFFDLEEYKPHPNNKFAKLEKLLFYGKQISNKALTVSEALKDALWWEQADNYKNAGFYVSYNNELMLPQSVTKKDYDRATQKVTRLVKNFRVFQLAVENSSQQEKEMIVSKLNNAVRIQTSSDNKGKIKYYP